MICIRSSLRFCCCGPFFGHYLVRCFHKFCIILLQENTNGEKRKEEIGVEDPSFACFSADVVCSCTLTISFPDFLFVCFCFFFLSDLMSSFWLFRKLWNTGNDSFSLFSICPSFLSFDTKVFLIPLFFSDGAASFLCRVYITKMRFLALVATRYSLDFYNSRIIQGWCFQKDSSSFSTFFSRFVWLVLQ